MLAFDAVVFDMDGVIFDSEREVLKCWQETGKKHGLDHVEDVVFACIGTNKTRTREIVLEYYGQDFPFDSFNGEASALYHSRYSGGRLPLKPGIRELLTWLKTRGKGIALASSTRHAVVTDELKAAGLLDFFDAVIGGDMVERSKPAPDIFLKACQALELEPERCFAIEDSYNGIRAAQAGGLRPLMVPDLLPANEKMMALAESIEKNLLDVITYLEALE
ncbi:MAG: HAD family phosphatase [Oscillospiraceae bacterium]|nr:HAD family phosphatase [Oscillospiraceae bacterium]